MKDSRALLRGEDLGGLPRILVVLVLANLAFLLCTGGRCEAQWQPRSWTTETKQGQPLGGSKDRTALELRQAAFLDPTIGPSDSTGCSGSTALVVAPSHIKARFGTRS